MGSASIVFWFLLGLLTPLLGGFTFGLIMAAVGWGLSTGGIKSFVEKSEWATKGARCAFRGRRSRTPST